MSMRVAVRAEEFKRVRSFFQPGIRVLEIGGGTGYQASLIASTGAAVDSIDVVESQPGVEIYFPVRISAPIGSGDPGRARGTWDVIKRVLRDGPHGEYPSAISELWYFSRRRWLKLFQECGFDLVEDWPSGIFYTGYSVFPSITIESRRKLARILGSATHVFVLRKAR